ncbi:MAG: tyrosine--tRNA ligase [Deltaproteobacteria bacterium]|nr:tyrosine--tRNA ligase [Deltaproteobacteria bacterium]
MSDVFQKIKKGSSEILSEEDLLEKLKLNRPLRIKAGFDPTAPDLHLGHYVLLKKLKDFQDAGHEVCFLIGDYTAAIGDPSGRNSTRPPLSSEEIKENVKTYQEQVFKILDPQKTKTYYNSTWFDQFSGKEMIQLASRYTVARMLERNDFEKRIREGHPVSIHEFLYPLLQGWDSVEMKADIEIGGTDQKFNLLMGRQLQREEGQSEQSILMMPLLEGLDGVEKMSKSKGNYIGITEAPETQFGKVMSISDALMWRYYELLTDLSSEEILAMEKRVGQGELHPKEVKIRLAKEIVGCFHSVEAAEEAAEQFERSFKLKEIEDLEDKIILNDSNQLALYQIVREAGFATSGNEAKAKVKAGAILVNDEVYSDPFMNIEIPEVGITLQGKIKKKRVRQKIRIKQN